jgi:hypothetical protein
LAIDRNLKARIWQYCHAYNRDHRTEDMHVGPITRAFQDVLRAVMWLACSPKRSAWSYETVAREANVGRDTVRAANTVLRSAGLISWTNTWQWNDRARRVCKSLNRYVLHDPIHKTENRSAPREQQEKGSEASQLDIGKTRADAPSTELEAAIGRLMAAKGAAP